MTTLVYETLVEEFERSLLTQLRGHGTALPYLEGWVPDEDPVLGVLNLLEAAEIGGEAAVSLLISQATLPAARLPELRQHAEALGRVELTEAGGAWRLEVSGIGAAHLLNHVAPAYRAALLARLDAAQLRHASAIHPAPGEDILSAQQGGITLSATVPAGSGIISHAVHTGAAEPVPRAALDYLCDILSGLPVQEASDHAAHRLLARLAAPGAPRPVPGILLPDNADPLFALTLALTRGLAAAWRQRMGPATTENEFATAPCSAWAALPAPARAAAVASHLAAFAAQAGLPEHALQLSAMEPNLLGHEVRAVIAFAEGLAAEAKPDLARRAERWLKSALDLHIELYVVELTDQNVIRRL